ncbi:hypothetical protein B0H17DRAFT_1183817 [Mycena rosella]|uniref:Uncharacterized protein n=1 Tax=Mycena rosella TaxID=1033263 RepID=A0AAD7CYB3_MYCRO|nr:hypothetical protein B0H17DRAFT_1183817 [Mycena rosella]
MLLRRKFRFMEKPNGVELDEAQKRPSLAYSASAHRCHNACAAAATSSIATDPASTLTPLATPTSVDPSLSTLPAPPPEPTERSAEAREQQVAATKLSSRRSSSRDRRSASTMRTLSTLAEVFGDVLQWTQFNKTISVEFWKVLKVIQERLVNHLTIVRESETTSSFSALLLQSLSPASKQLAERSEAQHKAIASLLKELEKPKTQQILSYAAVAAASAPSTCPRWDSQQHPAIQREPSSKLIQKHADIHREPTSGILPRARGVREARFRRFFFGDAACTDEERVRETGPSRWRGGMGAAHEEGAVKLVVRPGRWARLRSKGGRVGKSAGEVYVADDERSEEEEEKQGKRAKRSKARTESDAARGDGARRSERQREAPGRRGAKCQARRNVYNSRARSPD